MPLYAVCLAESVEDDKLVSVVKANSSEKPLSIILESLYARAKL